MATQNIRPHQKKAYEELVAIEAKRPGGVSVMLDHCVGSGKGAVIALAPYALKSNRTLVLCPTDAVRYELEKALTTVAGTASILSRIGVLVVSSTVCLYKEHRVMCALPVLSKVLNQENVALQH